MRHFTRTPHYSGPDDPEIGQVRGTLALGETVIIETTGGADNDFEAAGETRAGMITSGESHRRYARPAGPFSSRTLGRTIGWLSRLLISRSAPMASIATAVPIGAIGAAWRQCATG